MWSTFSAKLMFYEGRWAWGLMTLNNLISCIYCSSTGFSVSSFGFKLEWLFERGGFLLRFLPKAILIQPSKTLWLLPSMIFGSRIFSLFYRGSKPLRDLAEFSYFCFWGLSDGFNCRIDGDSGLSYEHVSLDSWCFMSISKYLVDIGFLNWFD